MAPQLLQISGGFFFPLFIFFFFFLIKLLSTEGIDYLIEVWSTAEQTVD